MVRLLLALACVGHRGAVVATAGETEPPTLQGSALSGGAVAERMAATIPYAEAEILGALAIDGIDAVLAAQIEPVHQCYQAALSERPDLAGLVKVQFVINGAGRLTPRASGRGRRDRAVPVRPASRVVRGASTRAGVAARTRKAARNRGSRRPSCEMVGDTGRSANNLVGRMGGGPG